MTYHMNMLYTRIYLLYYTYEKIYTYIPTHKYIICIKSKC